MSRIGIILGSTRPNRNGEQVAHWVLEVASRRRDAYFELLDLRDYPLPHLDEPLPPSFGQYQNEHTRQWAAKIASFDGFVIVTPEYNHGTSGVLKNAIDYLYAEWNNKAVGFVSYGSAGGARAVEHLRLVAGELNLPALNTMLDQVVAWSAALAPLRDTAVHAAKCAASYSSRCFCAGSYGRARRPVLIARLRQNSDGPMVGAHDFDIRAEDFRH